MEYTAETIKDLIRLGGHIKVSGTYPSETLKDFARLAKSRNVKLTIKANSATTETLKDLIRIAKNNIVLEL